MECYSLWDTSYDVVNMQKKKFARALLKSNYLTAIGTLIVRYLVCPFSAIALSLLDADSLSWREESCTIV
jgi:hypothetical protein